MMGPYGYLSSDPPTLVSNLIDRSNAVWRQDIIEKSLLTDDSKVIYEIPICTRNIEDEWAWAFERTEPSQFVVRNG